MYFALLYEPAEKDQRKPLGVNILSPSVRSQANPKTGTLARCDCDELLEEGSIAPNDLIAELVLIMPV